MSTKVIVGGILEKDERFLLVKENIKVCAGKWNIPAGVSEIGESIIDGAKREILEETGCEVEITGLLKIDNELLSGVNVICFIFDTRIMNDTFKADGNEIREVKWFTYEELLRMIPDLRADGYFLSAIKNKLEGRVISLDFIDLKKRIEEAL